ncbi:hypothetical protein BDY17DRAFT_67774 [Neohortaea acidophila]|uniref:Uncharacterized protein n=1 Tax=Neohortaea acidophila TaxID=245834 RepID=A0A6A6Q0Y1_9PEZI|nr:uncharacterized protein BDY17DRAFT_67774 [Neohortaea acidophila]KAF2485942.1 hypothetical protein BDY17DRAFT_67774 [Neohortaea acidophila]
MIVLIRKDPAVSTLPSNPSPPQDQTSTCRLLALPPEIRNQIWHDVLVQNLHPRLPLHHFPAVEASVRGPTRFCARILRTCRQIHAETTPILYGENVFWAHPTLLATMPKFLLIARPNRVTLPSPIVEPRVRKLIKRYFIFVRLDIDPRYSKTQVEESFNGVEALHIEVFQAMYGSCDFAVLKLFEGVRGVGKVTLEGSLGDRRYAEWLAQTMELPMGEEARPFSEEYVGGMKEWSAWQRGVR